jgi:hypothetical protein
MLPNNQYGRLILPPHFNRIDKLNLKKLKQIEID